MVSICAFLSFYAPRHRCIFSCANSNILVRLDGAALESDFISVAPKSPYDHD